MKPILLPAVRVALAAALALAAGAGSARAAVVEPWVPPGDTLLRFATEARLRFRDQKTDSVDERSIEAYQVVGQAVRHLLRDLGKSHLQQVHAIEGALDSLGLQASVLNDPQLPSIVLAMVRNPFRPSAQAVGYLFWYRGDDLRMQGATFPANVRPRVRAWWSGKPAYPYELAVAYDRLTDPIQMGFSLLRMSPDGNYWNLVQYDGHGPELGRPGDVAFVDVNHDGLPEMVSYSPADPDTFLSVNTSVSPIENEVIWTERADGFGLHDARTVPSPLASLRLFALLLMAHRRESAERLLVTPANVAQAFANGWDAARGPGAWTVEYGEPNEQWPAWLELRIRTRGAVRRWVFHFVLQDGRWLIHDWLPEHEAPGAAPPGGPPAPRRPAHGR